MTIKGTIIQILPMQEGTSKQGKAWKKVEAILQTEGQYPKKICFSLMNDKIEKYPLQLNAECEVDIDIESREYNGKWYTSVSAYNVHTTIAPSNQQSVQEAPQSVLDQMGVKGYPQQPNDTILSAGDDLPF